MLRALGWEIIYFLEVLKYLTAYHIALSTAPVRRRMLPLIVAGVLFPVSFFLPQRVLIADAYIFILILSIAVVFLMVGYFLANRFWKLAVIILCISALDSAMDQTIHLLGFSGDNELGNMLWSSGTLALLAVIAAGKDFLISRKPDLEYSMRTKLTQAAVVYASICLCSCAALIYLEAKGKSVRILLSNLSFLGVAFLGSQVWSILVLNSRMQELIKEERLLQVTQKEYYQSMLAREEETRKYRHDMNNHLIVMEAFLKENSTEELKNYLARIGEEFQKVSSKVYFTGNAVIDAISGHYIPSVADFTDIRIQGRLPSELPTDELNICIIYSNLLKNAVEELQRLREQGGRPLELLLEFRLGSRFMEINLSNSMRENPAFRGIFTPTSKEDHANHGFGLSNVYRTVEKENGTFTVTRKKGMFCARVILPFTRG